jgi:hypothetical protein
LRFKSDVAAQAARLSLHRSVETTSKPREARELCIKVDDKILPILEEAGLPNQGFYFWAKSARALNR